MAATAGGGRRLPLSSCHARHLAGRHSVHDFPVVTEETLLLDKRVAKPQDDFVPLQMW